MEFFLNSRERWQTSHRELASKLWPSLPFPLRSKLCATNPPLYREMLLIDADTGPTPFPPDPWQEADFQAMDRGWLKAMMRTETDVTQRGYLERPRGHSKTLDLAIMATFALIFAAYQLSGVVAAADRDQARLLRDAISRLVALNDWMGPLLEVQQWRIVNRTTGSALEILSSDAETSYGVTPDFVLIDELTHWKSRDLWDSLISSAAKRDHCLLIVISNAGVGMGTSWQWQVREACRTDPGFYFSRLDGPQASWITPDRLAEQRRLLPGPAFARLWENRWTSGGGDILDEAAIEAALSHGGVQLDAPEAAWGYAAGLDLGIVKDRASLVIVGRHGPSGRYRLARVWTWRPTQGRKVSISEVEDTIIAAHRTFRFRIGLADPWQGAFLVERLKAAHVPFALHPFTEPNLDSMARHVSNVFTEGAVHLYPDHLLLAGLRGMMIEEKASGKIRLTFPHTDGGHADEAQAFCLALVAARDCRPWGTSRPLFLGGGAASAYVADSPFATERSL